MQINEIKQSPDIDPNMGIQEIKNGHFKPVVRIEQCLYNDIRIIRNSFRKIKYDLHRKRVILNPLIWSLEHFALVLSTQTILIIIILPILITFPWEFFLKLNYFFFFAKHRLNIIKTFL